jgi:hypothetical protein
MVPLPNSGDFEADFKHGRGRLYLSNGEYFDGEFRDDCLEGNGTFYKANGEKVQGQWHKNLMI